jgi:dephospho-CoA kinase
MVKKRTARLIIGLTGPKGSGKGTVAAHLRHRYGATVLTFADILNDILAALAITNTRVNQIRLVTALRRTFGADVLARTFAARLARTAPHSPLVIDGIRFANECRTLAASHRFTLVGVVADAARRYQRIRRRGKTPEERTLSWRQFLAEERLPTETARIMRIVRRADFTVDANGSLSSVYRQINEIAKRLKLKAVNRKL